MIELVNVSKYYPTDFGRHYIFRDVSLVLPIDKSVGVVGPNGAGKSTFLRLLGGADIPSEGRILRTGRISPPMGLTPGLQSSLTGSENARFAGRIYGLERDEINDLIEYVRELSNIGKYFDMPIGTYSAGMKQRVAFAINMSMNFDYYLFDEISAGGDKEFRKTTSAMVQERLKTSKFIIASHRTDELLDLCDSGIVIQNGTLTFYDDIKDALAAYGGDDEEPDRRSKRGKRRAGSSDAPAEAGITAEAGLEGSAENNIGREAMREKRRQISMMKKQQAVPPEAAAPESSAAIIEAEPVEEMEDRDTKLKQRRLKRLSMKQQAVEADAPAAEAEPAIIEAEPVEVAEDRDTRLKQRRLKRLSMKQQAVEADAPAAEAEPAIIEVEPVEVAEDRDTRLKQRRRKRLSMKQQAVEADAPAAEAEPAIIEAESVEVAEDRDTRLKQRRRKRLSMKQQAVEADAPAAEAEPAIIEAESVEVAEDRDTRLKQRRRKRLLMTKQDVPLDDGASESGSIIMDAELSSVDEDRAVLRKQRRLQRRLDMQQASSTEEAAPEPDAAASETLPATGEMPEPTPALQERQQGFPLPQPDATAIPPVGKAPLARRLPPRPNEEPAASAAASAPPVAQAAVPAASPASPSALRFVGSKSFLAELASRRQGHAQATAARAAKLLLQHLDDLAGNGRTASLARAWLVASAQETAAMEAAQARDMLDKLLSGNPPGPSAGASPARTSPSGFGETANTTRPGLRRAAPSLTNPD